MVFRFREFDKIDRFAKLCTVRKYLRLSVIFAPQDFLPSRTTPRTQLEAFMTHEPSFPISRRRLMQLGALTGGAAVLGVGGRAAAGVPAAELPTGDQGADGAPAEDTRFQRKFATAQKSLAFASAAATSYNDWSVGSPASTIGVAWYSVPGSNVTMQVRSGDVATVLMYVAGRFNSEVERLDDNWCSGYSYRMNVNNPSVWSNHASGTALDLNFNVHPNGASVGSTFSAAKVTAIRRILTDCAGTVYWGGDYRGTVDGMHFEINVSPGDAGLTSLAARIRGNTAATTLRARVNNRFVCAENAGDGSLIANRTVAASWESFDVINRGGDLVALRSRANNRYVCAESRGAAPLIANRSGIGPWETFTLIGNTDGSVSLRAQANGRLVCAQSAGTRPLIANRTVIGPWEKFSLVRG